MGLFNFFGNQFQTALAQVVVNAYDRSVFKFLNNDQVILDENVHDYPLAFKQVSAVYECTDLIAKKIVASPRLIYKIKDAEGYKIYKNLMKSDNIVDRSQARKMRASVLEEVKVPKIDKILKKPNSKQNGDEFIEMLAGSILLRGNAYIYGNASDLRSKKWTEIFAMPAEMMIVSGGMFDPVKEYVLNWATMNEVRFPADQIKHIKTFNPTYSLTGSQLYGISPLMPYIYSMENIKSANKQANKQLNNGGKMGFISPKNKEDQFENGQKSDLKENLIIAHRSKDQLARIIPSSIPLDWTEIGLSSADMQLLEVKSASADDIYLGYHVPLIYRTREAMTYNNLGTAPRQFVYNAVAPIADKISAALTEFICEPFLKGDDGAEYIIHLDYSSLPELAEDMAKMAEWLEKSWELTPNQRLEVRGFGRSDAPGMDDIWIPKGFIRMQDVVDGKINARDKGTAAPAPTPTE